MKFNLVAVTIATAFVLLSSPDLVSTIEESTEKLGRSNLQHVISRTKLFTPLSYMATVYDGEDSIYIIGGLNETHSQARILKYSVDSDTIEVDKSLTVRIQGGSAIMLGDSILHFGGYVDGVFRNAVYSYSTVHKTWTLVTEMPLGKVNDATVAWDRSEEAAYLFGAISTEHPITPVIAAYYPSTSQTEILAHVEEPVVLPAAAWFEESAVAYIFRTPAKPNGHEVKAYDSALNNLTKLSTTLPYKLGRPCAICADNVDKNAYVFGTFTLFDPEGVDGMLIQFNPLDQEARVVEVDGWPHLIRLMSCAYVPKPGRIYIFGGYRSYNSGPCNAPLSDEISFVDLNPPDSQCTTESITGDPYTTTAFPDGDDDQSKSSSLFYMLIVGLPLIATAAVGVLLYRVVLVYRKRWRNRKTPKQIFGKTLVQLLSDEEVRKFHEGTHPYSQVPTKPPTDGSEADQNLLVESLPYNAAYEVEREDLLIGKFRAAFDFGTKLGTGHYGIVYKGEITQPIPIPVAVKTVKPSAPIEYFRALMSELKILAYIGRHENIANLMGSYSRNIKNGELFVAVEFCKMSLQQHLRDQANGYLELECPVPPEDAPPGIAADLVRWAAEIAAGMEFVSQKRIVHGDLAARNVLLSFDRRAKICDFGLARQLVDYTYTKTHAGSLPWKWLAIESLNHLHFSTKSDVWAYGVTLWEIFSLGSVPYPCARWNTDFLNELMAGHRLARPPDANQVIYSKMLSCWSQKREDRPSFSDLKEFFQEAIDSIS